MIPQLLYLVCNWDGEWDVVWRGLSSTPTLHRLPVRYDPVMGQWGPFMAPSTAKGQLERGPSQLGKQWGPGAAPALSSPAQPPSHRQKPDPTCRRSPR